MLLLPEIVSDLRRLLASFSPRPRHRYVLIEDLEGHQTRLETRLSIHREREAKEKQFLAPPEKELTAAAPLPPLVLR